MTQLTQLGHVAGRNSVGDVSLFGFVTRADLASRPLVMQKYITNSSLLPFEPWDGGCLPPTANGNLASDWGPVEIV